MSHQDTINALRAIAQEAAMQTAAEKMEAQMRVKVAAAEVAFLLLGQKHRIGLEFREGISALTHLIGSMLAFVPAEEKTAMFLGIVAEIGGKGGLSGQYWWVAK